MAEERSSPENPWPVRTVARKIFDWINRLGDVWVEGQVTQLSARPGTSTAFLTLRDPSADMSMQLTAPVGVVRELQLAEGSRVVVHGKPHFYPNRGTLSLRVDEIRQVGIGELLARIERLKKLLAAEGLFDPRRKRRPPFLPNKVGLITGRASAAERDVLTNAHARWPGARFRVVNVAVQGVSAVSQILTALSTLDHDSEVDVIVLARGGGSVEDLLPFSDEALCRAVAACRTPVVSAIGHEPDTPLVDHVADLRCSTPTDAGKRVVPDVAEETQRVRQMRDRGRRALRAWVDREEKLLASLRTRPALADPRGPLDRRAEDVDRLRERSRRAVRNRLDAEATGLTATRARLTTLGPAATLARGYAVVQLVTPDGEVGGVLRSTSQAPPGARLRVRVADGAVHAVVATGGDDGDGDAARAGDPARAGGAAQAGRNGAPAPAGASGTPAPAGTNDDPATAGTNDTPAPAGASDDPAPAGANDDPAPAGASDTPARAGTNDEPAPAGEDGNPARAGKSGTPARTGDDGGPAHAGGDGGREEGGGGAEPGT